MWMKVVRLFPPGKPQCGYSRTVRLLIVLVALFVPGCHTVETRQFQESGTESARVDRILARLLPHLPDVSCREYGIIDSAVPNASMNARGTLKLTTGLLEFAETDDLLAFAIAHELVHASLRHPQRQRRNGWLQVIATGAAMWAAHEATGSKSDAALTGIGFFLSTALLGTLPDMRRMEVEADRAASDVLRRAGYRPDAGAEFWRRYAIARPDRPRPIWLSGHPADATRVRLLSPPPSPRLRSPGRMGTEPESR
jgi:Zn-dependent protease with chaperone function